MKKIQIQTKIKVIKTKKIQMIQTILLKKSIRAKNKKKKMQKKIKRKNLEKIAFLMMKEIKVPLRIVPQDRNLA